MAKIKPTKIEAPKEMKDESISWVSRLSKEDVDAYIARGIDPYMEIVALARSSEPSIVTNEGVDTPNESKTPYSALQSITDSLQCLANAMQKAGEITEDEAYLFKCDPCKICEDGGLRPDGCLDQGCNGPQDKADNVDNIVPEED